MKLTPWMTALGCLALFACDAGSGSEFATDVPLAELRGAPIDGSEDAPETNDPQTADLAPEDLVSVESGQPAEPIEPDGPSVPEEPEPAEPTEIGKLREDGVREIAFLELSLEGLDPDEVVDSLLFPEDYPDQLVPQAILDLSGQRIAVTGYMIPGRIKKGGIVEDFLLVRDLLACCFGGMPKPDEWFEVVMAEGRQAEYFRYIPLTVTGVLTVGQDINEESLSPAIFKLVATDVRRLE